MSGEVEVIGPFTSHVVVVRGRRVPHLEATPLNGGMVALHLDHRFCVEISVFDAKRIVPFIADCIAVAMGYTGHPAADQEPVRRHPFPRLTGITSAEAKEEPR